MLPVRVWRHGSDTELAPRARLRAGPLTLSREEGDLCSISLGDREIVRRVYVAIRDRNWDTAKPVYSNFQEEHGEDSFRISFEVENRLREIFFSWKGLIVGTADGTITYTMDGTAGSTFLRNRIGFCVLHPDSCAGASCTLLHSNGATERSAFPTRIAPHQPFVDLRSISHEVSPGAWAEVAFEGDVFETEDQRNWTDASYKTYCTPLRLPFPVQVAAGTRVWQSVTIRVKPSDGAALAAPRARAGAAEEAASFEVDADGPGAPFPLLGVGSASHGMPLSEAHSRLLADLRLDHLRVDLDLAGENMEAAFANAAGEAARLGVGLEAAIFLSEDPARELARLAAAIEGTACRTARWLVFHRAESSTSDRWLAMARQVLSARAPEALFAAGTNAYFTELNRGAPPGPAADALVYSLNPQIHAFDDRSIMETLATQPATVESACLIGDGRPVIVSPITLKPRHNVVATGPIPPVPPGELPPQVDPRQMSLFAAAWTLGSIARLAVSGAASATYFETTGWRGLMETEAGSPVAERFPSLPGCPFPLYHVLADVGELGAKRLIAGGSSAPLVVHGLSIRSEAGLHRGVRTLVANLTETPRTVSVRAVGPGARVRYLDETTVERACLSPREFRAEESGRAAARQGRLELTLLAYAVARIDWEA